MSLAVISGTGAQSDTAILAAQGAGKCIRVWRLHVAVSSASSVSISDGADAAGTRRAYITLAAGVPLNLEPTALGSGAIKPLWIGTANTALNVTTAAGNVFGMVEYDVV